MNFDIPKYHKRIRSKRKKLRAIESPSEQQVLANDFVQIFHRQMHNFSEFATSDIIEDKYTAINHVLHEAASKQEIPSKSIPLRPWISSHTLRLIDERNEARLAKNFTREEFTNKLIKLQARVDRREFLLRMLDDGNWDEIKKLRKGMRFKSGRIRNLDGELVDRSEKAETLAQYFMKIQ